MPTPKSPQRPFKPTTTGSVSSDRNRITAVPYSKDKHVVAIKKSADLSHLIDKVEHTRYYGAPVTAVRTSQAGSVARSGVDAPRTSDKSASLTSTPHRKRSGVYHGQIDSAANSFWRDKEV